MDKNKNHVSIDYNELAVPEVHTEGFDEAQKEIEEEENRLLEEQQVKNEFVAIPEIHFSRKKKQD